MYGFIDKTFKLSLAATFGTTNVTYISVKHFLSFDLQLKKKTSENEIFAQSISKKSKLK